MEFSRARHGEIPELRVVRPLLVDDALDQFRDHEVEIHVSLAVAMGRQVYAHALDPAREIRAVVEIESAQEILVRLPIAAVLRDDESRHHFEQLAGAQERPVLELVAEYRALARGARVAGERDALGRDDDFLEPGRGDAAGERCTRGTGKRHSSEGL